MDRSCRGVFDETGRRYVPDFLWEAWRNLEPDEILPEPCEGGDPRFLAFLVQRAWPALQGIGTTVATAGSRAALTLSARVLLEAGMRVLAPAPFSPDLIEAASLARIGIATAPLPAPGSPLDREAWTEALRTLAVSQGRILLWLPDPCHEPTGTALSPEARCGLMDLLAHEARTLPVSVILVGRAWDFAAQPEETRAALGEYARVAQEGGLRFGAALSLSRTLFSPDLRAGALTFPWCRDEAFRTALLAASGGPLACPRAPQSLALRLRTDGKLQAHLDDELRHWSQVFAHRAASLREALAPMGLPLPVWSGGFEQFLPGFNAPALFQALEEAGFHVGPHPEGLRINLGGLPVGEIPRFVQALETASGQLRLIR